MVGALAFVRRRITGDYEVDEFGFDPDLADHVAVPAFRPLFEKWFRTEVHGIENLPVEGGALLVANHGGAIWALDAVMTAIAVHDRTPGHRYLRMLGADLIFSTPVLGPFARKTGSTLACQPDAERLLRNGELVGVWPEGFKGIGKPFHERYKLQRFGRGGFVTAALRTGVPIIPVSIVGAEEIHPMLFNASTLARVMGLAVLPGDPDVPVARAAGAGAAAEQMAHRVRRADRHGRTRARRGRRPVDDVRAHRPGSGNDPGHAVPAAVLTYEPLELNAAQPTDDAQSTDHDMLGHRAARLCCRSPVRATGWWIRRCRPYSGFAR